MDDPLFLRRFAETRRALIAAIQGLNEEQLAHPNVEGIWSVREILGHIASWEEVCLVPLTGYANGSGFLCDEILDHDAWNAVQSARKQSWTTSQILDDLHTVRKYMLAALDRLTPEQWTAPISLPWGEITPATGMVSGLAWHEDFHTQSILTWKESLK